MKKVFSSTTFTSLCCTLLLLSCRPAFALEVEAMNYPAWLVRNYETRPLLPGARIEQDDLIRTGEGGRVRLRLADGSELGVGQNTRLLVEYYSPAAAENSVAEPARLQVLRGVFRYSSAAAGTAPGVEIKIGAIAAKVQQGELWGRSDQEQDLACLISGGIDVFASDGVVTPMQQARSCYVKPRTAEALPVDQVDMQQHRLWLEQSRVDSDAGIAAADGEWQLVLISLSDIESAERELWRLRDLGYPVNKKSVIRGGRTLHRLLIPGFVSVEDALAAGKRVEKGLGIRDAWIWKSN